MKLLAVKVECSHELEDGLSFFMQDELDAQGIESRKRSDFIAEGQKHDSSLVELDDIENLPKDLELTAYFDYESADKKDLIKKIMDKIAEMKSYGLNTGEVSISSKEVADEDWNTAWQKYYHVIDFSRHLAIVPEWEDYHPAFSDQKLIRLDPGLAFGTGGHTTTQLVLLAMERAIVKPMSVLDVGTGSGILAIAASKLGASHVLGTDISDEAVTAAKENIALNDVDNIDVRKANLLKDIDDKYDLIVANILADILLELIPDLDSHLNKEGKVIFSGIDYLQLPKIEKSLAENGFEIKMKMQEGRWIGLLIARKPD
ncbi:MULTISPECIES: 50S ribosomal protein L11 methyltransferase [Lactobacillus]|uniref:Ribosomal protein L11 methyltransferase n=1 Tax=Lactobacillus gasseri TaxID=1596 RepID=A0A8A4UY95_LACGS|nr:MULTISPECIES: 50S ribosomal protein L11 methyltransferase [Lactobacillus]MBW8451440.1 50S ribosomal protein L11 methyltransferase [Lactobacillus paragasseri]MYM17648.1 50S ribosomal protein L11 methyltransferase [Lactobacillus gasseri]QTD66497.1 50S ribosomal protein L11 methyltransferase [Lactobacillus gasseri]